MLRRDRRLETVVVGDALHPPVDIRVVGAVRVIVSGRPLFMSDRVIVM